MSQFYSPKRTRNLYDPKSGEPYRLSRSKIELFLECPRCFYLDRRLGVNRPKGPPFTLNSAVDALLKKEFDIYRDRGEKHPIMEEHGIDAIPVSHPKLDEWRENFVGVQYHHQPTNLTITGAIDDLWQDSQGEYIVAEYKATSKDKVITELDEEWQDSYKRQMELYQWLLRKNELPVSDMGYFIYCNGVTEKETFNERLNFEVTLIPYGGNDNWVEDVIIEAHKCLTADAIPPPGHDCDFCAYREAVKSVT